jgi:hypothetical protein
MTDQPVLLRPLRASRARILVPLALVCVVLVATGGCAGTAASPVASVGATLQPTPGASGATACIDAGTNAIIQSLTKSGADVATIIAERGDELVAGLQRFTPPANATTWRDELVAAIQSGDATAVQTKVAMIGSEVKLDVC